MSGIDLVIAVIVGLAVFAIVTYWWPVNAPVTITRSAKATPENHAQMLRDAAEAQGCRITEWLHTERDSLYVLGAIAVDIDTGEEYLISVTQMTGPKDARQGEAEDDLVSPWAQRALFNARNRPQ